MYAPKLYRNNDLPEIERFIRKKQFCYARKPAR
jgi:hypothetical protein